ncbi:hypothetical protein IMZ11_33695 [Microtetraspora sp. AC03309]|uniref:phage tail tube protein n=1 Tax=Microtetraspora sp. AC03309 TaxID=2779376 RepID=UPI001E55DFAE|nr:hypothetical protein [Microtetraspora sp. AC03309]MCC5580583.1 hypothetical protein [Microtetraspora sp. AC03309]
MTQRKINARDIIIEVEDDTPDTWLRIENLATVTHNPGENEETVDTTDYDSEGAYEQEIMQRGSSLALEGQAKKDHLTGALQPGRARVEEMAGEDKVGYDSLGRVRFRHPMDAKWRVWDATFSLGEQGGGPNDKTSWSATITKSGKTTLVDVV